MHVIKSYRTLQIDSFSRLNLELVRTIRSEEKYGSLYWLLDHTKTAMGGRLLKHWIQKPSSDLEEILSRQSMVTALIEHFMKREELIRALDAVYDLERLIARISFGNANGRDLLQLKTSLKAVPVLKDILNEFENENLKKIASSMDALEDIASLIEKAIREDAPITIKEGGIFLPGYNAELDELIELSHGGKSWVAELEAKERERTGIRTLKVGYNRVFGYYIEVSKGAKDLIQEDWGYERKQTTINGERFITQELKEKEALILNADEKRMKLEYDLFLELRKVIQNVTRKIQNLANQIAKVDVLVSLAEVSAGAGYVLPTFNQERRVDIEKVDIR